MWGIYRQGREKSNGGFWKFNEYATQLFKSVHEVSIWEIVCESGHFFYSSDMDARIAGVKDMCVLNEACRSAVVLIFRKKSSCSDCYSPFALLNSPIRQIRK